MTGCASTYVDDGYWVDGYSQEFNTFSMPSWAVNPVTDILTTTPSYLYQQYQPDDEINAFFTAYNIRAQADLDYLVKLNLPVWTSPSINGYLLDWVAFGLYGFKRPTLTFPAGDLIAGMYNTFSYNIEPYNDAVLDMGSVTTLVNDDIFKRILTWNLYKGDGFQYSTRWLKNRVYRFLATNNGCYPNVGETYPVSIDYVSITNITIAIDPTFIANMAPVLQAAITAQVLNLPFQYNYTVTI